MPPRRRTRPAPPDVDALRTALEAGKIVRVGIIPSDQFPEGITGRVRRIGDPAQDGEEFLFVEVSVGGAKDVLPFAPRDLTGSPPRKQAATVTAGPGGGRSAQPAGPGGPVALFAATASAPTSRTPPAVAAPSSTAPVAGAGTSDAPAAAAPTRTRPTGSSRPDRTADATGPDPRAGEPSAAGPGASSRRPTGAAARGKRPPVTITISTTGDETASWRVEARIGARTAVRPTPVPPSRVWEIVESLGEPRLTAVVQTLLDEHRRSTQARADVLAAELAALRTELSSYPSADG